MDTITLERIERDGQALLLDLPLVFGIRLTTVTAGDETFPMWQADLLSEHPLDLVGAGVDPARLRPPAGAGPGAAWWGASPNLSLHTLAREREDLPAGLAFQLWYWWDMHVNGDDERLSPENRASARYLRPRLRLVSP